MMVSTWVELISSAQLCKCTLLNIHSTPRGQTATAINAFFYEPSASTLIFHPDPHPKPTELLLGLQAAGLEEETDKQDRQPQGCQVQESPGEGI